jgi:hypothetical protein
MITSSAGLLLWLRYGRVEIGLTPSQSKDIEIAFKGKLGEALFHGESAYPNAGAARTDSQADSNVNNEGLISDYIQNPAKFKHYSELFDTAMNATKVGEVIAQRKKGQPLRETSAGISSMESKFNLDAWGHPFCIIDTDGGVAVVSGGPDSNSFSCSGLSKSMLVDSPKMKFREMPSGAVVVLVDRDGEPPKS